MAGYGIKQTLAEILIIPEINAQWYKISGPPRDGATNCGSGSMIFKKVVLSVKRFLSPLVSLAKAMNFVHAILLIADTKTPRLAN